MVTRVITLNDLLSFDKEGASRAIEEFIRGIVSSSRASGVVIGLSGGVDSSTAAYLAVNALGSNRVHALIMPDKNVTPTSDIEDAKSIAAGLGIDYTIIDIAGIYEAFSTTIPFFNQENNIACGNLRARIRMCLLYYYANLNNCLVLGTGDRSELLIGYFTKYGDGGVDMLPLGCLYKTQVRELAKFLGVPSHIAEKPSSPRLWPGHMAEEELGLKYEEIDLVLYATFDLGIDPSIVDKATGVSREKVDKILDMHRNSRHKRAIPPIPRLPHVRSPIKEV